MNKQIIIDTLKFANAYVGKAVADNLMGDCVVTPENAMNKIQSVIDALEKEPQLEQAECKFEDWDDTQEPAISHCTLVDDFETNNRCGHRDVRDCKYYVQV
jgi:hypothetical protein